MTQFNELLKRLDIIRGITDEENDSLIEIILTRRGYKRLEAILKDWEEDYG